MVPLDRQWGLRPNDQWFAVYCDRYAPNPFISQRWDEVMHLVSDPETQADAPRGGCFRRFFQGVCFKGGFTSAWSAWRFATQLVDDNLPCPPSLAEAPGMQQLGGVPFRYHAI